MKIERVRKELLELIFRNSFKRGDYKLSSGKFSNYYLDIKQVTLEPKGSALIANLIIDKIIKSKIESIGGLTIGADPIVGSIITLGLEEDFYIRGFIVRKEEKKHGLHKRIEGKIRERDRVLIIEDVATTGGSTLQAVKAVEELKCEVVKIVPVVDRNEGARELFKDYDYNPLIKIEEIFGLERELESYNAGGQKNIRTLRSNPNIRGRPFSHC